MAEPGGRHDSEARWLTHPTHDGCVNSGVCLRRGAHRIICPKAVEETFTSFIVGHSTEGSSSWTNKTLTVKNLLEAPPYKMSYYGHFPDLRHLILGSTSRNKICLVKKLLYCTNLTKQMFLLRSLKSLNSSILWVWHSC